MSTDLVFERSVKRRLLSLPPGRSGDLYGLRRSDASVVVAFALKLHTEELFAFPLGITRLSSFQTHDPANCPEPQPQLQRKETSIGESPVDDGLVVHISSKSDLEEVAASEVGKGLWLLHGQIEASDLHVKDELAWYEALLQGGKGVFVAPNGVAIAADNMAPLARYAPTVGSQESGLSRRPKGKGKSKGKGKGKGKKSQKSSKGRDVEAQGWQLPDGDDHPCVAFDDGDRLLYGAHRLFESIHEFKLFFDAGSTEKEAPVLRFERPKNPTSRACSVEVAIVAAAEEAVGEVMKRCVAALRSRLRMMEESRASCSWTLFYPNALRLPVIVKLAARSEGEAEEAAAAERKKLHEVLGLGLDSPYFQRMNTLRNASIRLSVETGVLRSPHLGSYGKSHSVNGGVVHLIEGDFDYYHYTSNGYDDRGWGCAYRSFQMAFSWFRLAGFTEKLTPNILRIQEKLHDMDVMDAHFYVGCKQWIGSQEVAWLLEDGVGASCRFLVCSRGSEIVEKARELATHFDTHKTPIVMCGSNLALTLLGIAWNAESGEVSFLIADPHYTGADDLETIQQKQVSLEGYRAIPVSWRGPEAFSSNANYTLCMPLRPQVY